jgi:hypothetical protein
MQAAFSCDFVLGRGFHYRPAAQRAPQKTADPALAGSARTQFLRFLGGALSSLVAIGQAAQRAPKKHGPGPRRLRAHTVSTRPHLSDFLWAGALWLCCETRPRLASLAAWPACAAYSQPDTANHANMLKTQPWQLRVRRTVVSCLGWPFVFGRCLLACCLIAPYRGAVLSFPALKMLCLWRLRMKTLDRACVILEEI